jgi:hypothetical protein
MILLPMPNQQSPCMCYRPKATHLAQSAHSPEQPGALNGAHHHIHFGTANVLAITWLPPSVQPGRRLWSVPATQSSDQESRSPLRQQKDILLRVTTGLSFVNHTTTPPVLFIDANTALHRTRLLIRTSEEGLLQLQARQNAEAPVGLP